MIVTSRQMKQIEKNANDMNMSYQTMMENAGRQAAQYIRQTLRQIEGLKVAVFCGKGNNGGDGFVAARHLTNMGCRVVIVLTDGEPRSEEARYMMEQAAEMKIPMLNMDTQAKQITQIMEVVDVVVDAMYGSGFHGELDDFHKEASNMINNAIAAIFALDAPSGVSCDTGEVSGDSVMADFTIVFDSAKPTHLLSKIIPNMGRIVVADIGIPKEAHDGIEELVTTTEEEDLKALLPKRAIDCHKTSTGRLVNFAGSFGMAGAAVLSGMGALRSGAGYLVTVTPREIYPVIASQLIQSTFKFVGEDADVRSVLGGASSVAIGCGLGQGEYQRTLLRHVLETVKCPLLIDADGINNLSRDVDMLRDHTGPVILTPHAGEMASLCKVHAQDVLRQPIAYAQAFAQEYGVIVVLKGANTIIADPQGHLVVNSTGNPGLAKAGSGDVLTGIISSFISQGMSPLDAAKAGVYFHGLAADHCAERLGQRYMQPDDILTDLGEILK